MSDIFIHHLRYDTCTAAQVEHTTNWPALVPHPVECQLPRGVTDQFAILIVFWTFFTLKDSMYLIIMLRIVGVEAINVGLLAQRWVL